MSDFDDALAEVEAYLPLRVGYVLLTATTLTFGEMRSPEVVNWSFSTFSAWRLAQETRVLSTCEWQPELLEGRLLEHSIARIEYQGVARVPDPAFILDNGVRLEVFSTHIMDPWTFRLPNGTTMIAEIL